MAGITARQSTRCSGAERANIGRLLVGLLILGIIAIFSWSGMPFRLMTGLAIAGGVGFGFGGYFMMHTLKRLGTPTSLLFVESLTAIIAGIMAWVIVKDKMTARQMSSCAIILSGVLFAGWTWMKQPGSLPARLRFAGYSFGFLSASCQAFSLVISRQVFLLAAQQSQPIDKLDAAFVRLVGGAVIASVLLAITWFRRPDNIEPDYDGTSDFHWIAKGSGTLDQPLFWILINGIFGPVLGVTCWLWAVSTINPGIVQSIAAVSPLISIPVARLLEQEKLGAPFFIGAPLAILGITLLALS